MIRVKYGTKPRVLRVFAYDPEYGTVLAMVSVEASKNVVLHEYDIEELEFIDENGLFGDTHSAVFNKAEYIHKHTQG